MSNAAQAVKRASELYNAMIALQKFVNLSQMEVLSEAARNDEEREYFIELMIELNEWIDAMPKTGDTDGQGDDAIVYLHYFHGSMDFYITEKDMEDEQHQAFGWADLGWGCGELGYISIVELIENGIELDLHWIAKPLSECK